MNLERERNEIFYIDLDFRMLTTVLPWLLKVSPSDPGSSPSPLTDLRLAWTPLYGNNQWHCCRDVLWSRTLQHLCLQGEAWGVKHQGFYTIHHILNVKLRTWSLIKPYKLQERKLAWISITSPNPIHQSKGDIYPSLNWFKFSGGYLRHFRIQTNFQISKLKCNCQDFDE